MSSRPDFLAGVRAMAPLLPGAASIGLITGVAASSVGLAPLPAVAMSLALFSPIVMLTSFHLLSAGAPLLVIVFASLVVAVRFAMLSLSIAPSFERAARRWQVLVAYFLVTPTYIVSLERFRADPATDRVAFYLGASLPGWAVIQATFVLGLRFGGLVPSAWQLGFVIPLAFIALLVRFLSDRAGQVAALAAGVLAVVGAGLPFETGVIVAVVGGTAAGLVARTWEGP